MRKLRLFGASAVAAVLLVAVVSMAVAGDDRGSNRFSAGLTGYQEVPANATTGMGALTLETQGDRIAYTLTYSALEGGTVFAAHIHLGQRSVNGGVIAFLCGGSKPACTTPSGSFTGVITAADVVGPNSQGIEAGSFAEAVQAIRAGVVYANIHSTPRWPGGEIRGQVRERGQADRGHESD
jgi:hypothetical protein